MKLTMEQEQVETVKRRLQTVIDSMVALFPDSRLSPSVSEMMAEKITDHLIMPNIEHCADLVNEHRKERELLLARIRDMTQQLRTARDELIKICPECHGKETVISREKDWVAGELVPCPRCSEMKSLLHLHPRQGIKV